MKALLLAAGLVLLLQPAALAQDHAGVDELVEPYLGDEAPGIAVLVTRNGEPIHLKGYGLADIEAGTPIDEHSLFDLASVSKQMTALAALLLIEDGKLALDTPVADLIPAFGLHNGDHRPLVVADLIHHLGGLADYLDGELDYAGDTPDSAVVAWLARMPRLRPPGTAFDYSNSGYVVLGSLVAAADGAADLGEVLRRRVWGPLGMSETGMVTPANPSAVVTGYLGTGGAFEPSAWPNTTQGDGNVFTSIADLARYERALHANSLLSYKAPKRLFANGKTDDGTPIDDGNGAGYGFGWTVETWQGSRYAWHDGSWYGTATAYIRNLDTGVSVIVLSNGEDLDVVTLAFDIEAAVE